MRAYVLDANAIIILFEGRNGAEKVQKLIDAASDGNADVYMSAMNVG